MLPTQLFAIVVAFLLHPPIGVTAADRNFLANTLLRKNQVQNVLEHQPAKGPTCQQTPTGPIETTLCDYETVESHNDDLYTHLKDLVRTPFFKYFRVDLYRECPFWQENGFCMNRECGITTTDESEIPERWRAAALSKVEMPPHDQRHELPGCYYRDSDFCFLDDMSEGDYIDLTANPERFTGYAGVSARRVWASIYEENCFGMSEFNLLSSNSPNPAPVSLPDSMTGVLRAEGVESSKSCLEKRVYYKIISGLHASISTHVCHDTMNQTTGEWGPNLQCFISRVAAYPERLQYIYFNVVLLLRAVARLGPYLSAYDYCGAGKVEDDTFTHEKLGKVIKIAQEVGKFDETVLFRGENANILKEEFKSHFRNVSRIMDCVGCDKCRLWGKIQTSGLGTALKVLFELDEKALNPHLNANLLSRSEVVALINTLHRFSESLAAVNDFRTMWKETNEQQAKHLITEAEKEVQASSKPIPSPAVGKTDFPATFIGDLLRWVRACKQGTVFCVRGLVQGMKSLLQTISSFFQLSGKEGPPRSEF